MLIFGYSFFPFKKYIYICFFIDFLKEWYAFLVNYYALRSEP